uniref:WH2 domain-containing protein n=1 Tax=Anolis carolinensis TaxID=28377 RepID=H9G9F9_ANOCA
MEDAPPDSLEGWVAVKEDPFGPAEPPHNLRFLVAWNGVEGQFALTCHNRTLQERGGPEAEAAEEEEPTTWAALFTPQALRGLHGQLSALAPALEAAFPELPQALTTSHCSSAAPWALLFFPSRPALGEAELEAALLDALFARDTEEEARYFEGLAELRRKALKAGLGRAKEALRQVGKHNTDKLVALMELYQEEDEAYLELVTVATEFYQYLLQPFRDMRELATLYRREILKSLQANKLGPKRVEALRKEAEEWANQAEEAVNSIQDITVSYFKETVTALAAMQKQIEQDQKRFGQAAWASASPRLENLKYLLAKETLQYMRAKELCLKHKRADIQKQVRNCPWKNDVAQVEELEIEYYETQLELYEVQFEILKNEELLLTAQLETLRRRMKEIQDEVIYYDTCETPDELEATELVLEEPHKPSSEMAQLRQKTQQLETKRGIICSRRAYLRNKKKCPAQFVLKTSRPLNTKQPQMASRRSPAASPQPLLTSKMSATKQPRASRQAREAKSSKAACQKTPKEIPVQIFVPPNSLEKPNKSEGASSLMVPPPPPPPLPPPPPPLPSIPPIVPKRPQETPLILDEGFLLIPFGKDKGESLLSDCSWTMEDLIHLLPPTGSMDEVLASLKRGEVLLRKVEPPSQAASSSSSLNDSILAAIRQGVKLRKVSQEPKTDMEKGSSNELERSIKAAIQRIKKASADSEEDENNDHNSGEWNG